MLKVSQIQKMCQEETPLKSCSNPFQTHSIPCSRREQARRVSSGFTAYINCLCFSLVNFPTTRLMVSRLPIAMDLPALSCLLSFSETFSVEISTKQSGGGASWKSGRGLFAVATTCAQMPSRLIKAHEASSFTPPRRCSSWKLSSRSQSFRLSCAKAGNSVEPQTKVAAGRSVLMYPKSQPLRLTKDAS